MKKIVIHAGFHPEVEREYKGEHIYKVTAVRDGLEGKDFHTGRATGAKLRFFRLDNGAWIKDLGGEKYETDWTNEERWGRVEEVELDEKGDIIFSEELGFMILRVDRARGLL